MKTQDTIDEQTPSPGAGQPRGISRLAAVGAMLVVLLIVGASAIVFAQLSQQREKGQTQALLPPAGTWVQVYKGYTVTSVTAANNASSMLYACATREQAGTVPPSQGATSSSSSYTILLGTDFGSHWRDVGSKADLGISCQFAINPTNSNELYAVGTLDNGEATSVLRHSGDAGQTWETVQPVLNIGGTSSVPAWSVQDISMVGSALFGMQWLPPGANPATHVMPRVIDRSNRLVTSTDGGHTWKILDQQFASTSVSDYAVDPLHTNTIYELLGRPWLSVLPGVHSVEPNNIPPFGTSVDLYKTTDGGAHWQLLLQKLPFATQIHLAADNPQLLYIGGTQRPIPYVLTVPAFDPYPPIPAFHLQVSSDGGATWRSVPDLPSKQAYYYIANWFVSPGGQVYAYSSSSGSSNGTRYQPTVGATAIEMPPGTPPEGAWPRQARPLLTTMHHPALTPPPTGPISLSPIQRYNSGSNAWSEVTRPPTYGTLLAVTPGNAHGDVLWFVGNTNGQASLYRYIA